MNDLISRQAAIKAIDDLPNCYNGYSDTYDKAYIIGVLEELPGVELRRERDWNGWEDGKGGTYLYDERVLDTQPRIGNIDSTSIVNCGAKMERSEE